MICALAYNVPFHVGIVTPDFDGLVATLGPALGLRWVALPRPGVQYDTPQGPTAPASRVMYSAGDGPPYIELLPAEAGTIYDASRGTHVHHFGYWVDDFSGAVAQAEADGWTLEVTMFDDDDRPSTFAYLSRPGQLWIELVESVRRFDLIDLLRSAP
jgi:hypothetical protein